MNWLLLTSKPDEAWQYMDVTALDEGHDELATG
jgi:hypothetical protein